MYTLPVGFKLFIIVTNSLNTPLKLSALITYLCSDEYTTNFISIISQPRWFTWKYPFWIPISLNTWFLRLLFLKYITVQTNGLILIVLLEFFFFNLVNNSKFGGYKTQILIFIKISSKRFPNFLYKFTP